jgi:hypothetical protein
MRAASMNVRLATLIRVMALAGSYDFSMEKVDDVG